VKASRDPQNEVLKIPNAKPKRAQAIRLENPDMDFSKLSMVGQGPGGAIDQFASACKVKTRGL
jgi:hypothetical protein